ncbi:stage II sporulation protein M [Candidatus Woesearchaeota archaeon]|nr:stage II sporulation protein M [Candidatus Woesearchaeota archaeon]
MVFESLVNPVKAGKKPWEMFFIGLIYSSLAIMLGLYIFAEHASLVAIFLTVLAATPFMYTAIKIEEKKDLVYEEEAVLIKEHGKALSFFMFLFMGFVVSFSIWYVFLPEDVTFNVFSVQIKEIERVQGIDITGNAVSLVGIFGSIFFNNLVVMIFALIFAFFYGTGAIFILTWNASVIGAAIGHFVHSTIGLNYFSSFSLGLLRYSIHGVPEMLAYFMAGLAGGIISVAISRHDFGSGKFRHILTDSLDLVFLAVFVLFFAALLEVFVTPLFF